MKMYTTFFKIHKCSLCGFMEEQLHKYSAVVNCLPEQTFNIKITYNRCCEIYKHTPYPIMYWTQNFEKPFGDKYVEVLDKKIITSNSFVVLIICQVLFQVLYIH